MVPPCFIDTLKPRLSQKAKRFFVNAFDECPTRKPDAGNLHVRFDEGEGAAASGSPSLLYMLRNIISPRPKFRHRL